MVLAKDAVEILGMFLGVVLVGVAVVTLRRYLLQRRGGAVEMSLRLRSASHGRGWALGIGRFETDALTWYRAFSVSPRPRRSYPRAGFSVDAERRPTGPEALALQAKSVVLRCNSDGAAVELAMSSSAVTGFRAWLEGAPPRSRLSER